MKNLNEIFKKERIKISTYRYLQVKSVYRAPGTNLYDNPYLSDSIPLIITETAGRTKVTESLRQEVVQMKAKGMTRSPTAREVGHSKSVILQILQLYNDANSSPPKRLVVYI